MQHFLNGKVSMQSLPVMQVPVKPGEPRLKRLALAQGELAQIYDGGEGIRYLAYLELQSGSVRGNHYHTRKEEWVYVIRGEMVVTVEDLESKERASIPVAAGDLVLIGTGVAHAMRIKSPGDAVEFSAVPFDAQDVHRHIVDG